MLERALQQLGDIQLHLMHEPVDAMAEASFCAIVTTLEQFLAIFPESRPIASRGNNVDLFIAALLRFVRRISH